MQSCSHLPSGRHMHMALVGVASSIPHPIMSSCVWAQTSLSSSSLAAASAHNVTMVKAENPSQNSKGGIPKPVARVREILKNKGLEANPVNLKTAVPKAELNKLAGAFRSSLSEGNMEGYKQLRTDDERRSWLAQYVVDPDSAACKGFNKTSAYNTSESRSASRWLTQAQLASASCLNDNDAAKTVCESGDLESRLHELPSLAAKGVKQYYLSENYDFHAAGLKDEAGVSAESDLHSGELEEVKEHMLSNFGRPGKRRCAPKHKEPESDESKQLRAAAASRATSVRKLKQLLDKVHNEMENSARDVPKLEEKGYPIQMLQWLLGKVAEVQSVVEEARLVYAEEVTKPDSKLRGMEALKQEQQRADDASGKLEQQFQAFKKTAGADIKKLTS
jgi:hypothetical protein